MKLPLKNLSSLNNFKPLFILKQKTLLGLLLFLFAGHNKAQIANYVNNGGFEIPNPNNMQKPLYWDAIDTNKYMGILLSQTITPYLVPNSGYTHQWPVQGSNHLISTLLFKPSLPASNRGYPRNKLKQTLQSGKTYCVKLYINISDQSTYGVDGFGVYFGDNSTDTISQCSKPISYLTPQIQYTAGFITDTMNWIPITGTFVANGTEKYIMLGNFKSDANTNTVLINPTNLPTVDCDILYDNVSVMDLNLPVFAGNDTFFVAGDSIYLGRQSDVGIDEACVWYKLPSATPIDTIAGFWVKPAATSTYVVKQDICGMVKWDTVIVTQSAIGINEVDLYNQNLKLFPQPAQDFLKVEFTLNNGIDFDRAVIYNNLGQMVREEEITFINKASFINLNGLANGVYSMTLSSSKALSVNRRFIVAR